MGQVVRRKAVTTDALQKHGLGCPMRWQTGFWHLDRCTENVAHKLSGIESSSSSARMLPPTYSPSPCTCLNRQYSSGGLHKSPERSALASQTGEESHGEWRLHPRTVAMIWDIFGKAEVDLFASEESTDCPLYFSLTQSPLGVDELAHSWPSVCKYVFPPVKLLPIVIQKIREEQESVLLVAPK